MEPSTVASSYYEGTGMALTAVPSDYEFNRGTTELRVPVQTNSEYQFVELNPWKFAGKKNEYNYVKAQDLPRPSEHEITQKGNVISLKALKQKLEHLEGGYYQPTLVNGVFYLVPSNDQNLTARESESATALDTAREADLKTALERSPGRKSSTDLKSNWDFKLSLRSLRRLLGKELFNEVLSKYKTQQRQRKESASVPAADVLLTAMENDTDRSQSEYSLRTAISDSGVSSKDVITARSFGAFDEDAPTMTAREYEGDVASEMRQASGYESDDVRSELEDYSTKGVYTAREPSRDEEAYARMQPEANVYTAEIEDLSSKDVSTAHEITNSVREMMSGYNSSYGNMPLSMQRSVTEMGVEHHHLTRTPQSFDQRAAASAMNLGVAHDHHEFVAVDEQTGKPANKSAEELTTGHGSSS